MPSSLKQKLVNLSKHKRFRATVINVAGDKVTVNTGTSILRGLGVIGSMPKLGDPVFLDYSTGIPMVQSGVVHPVTVVTPKPVVARIPDSFAPSPTWPAPSSGLSDFGWSFVFAPATGGTNVLVGYIEVPPKFNCTLHQVSLYSNAIGSIVVGIWKQIYASLPPTSGNSICGSSLPTLSSALKYQDTMLSGWTTQLSAGDILAVVYSGNSGIAICTLALSGERT